MISGILNCVCPDCGRSMGGAGKRSSANASVRGTGVRSGSRVLRVLHVDGRGWGWYMPASQAGWPTGTRRACSFLSFEVRSARHRIKTWTKEFEQRAIEGSTLRRRTRESRENTNLEELQ